MFRLFLGHGICLAAGAILPLSLAPFNLWPLGIIATTVLAISLRKLTGAQGLWRSFCFGLGMFGIGASWVYISIAQYGMASPLLAGTLTALFVAGLALVFALPFYFYCRYYAEHRSGFMLAFPIFWLLGEWLRSWLLTGFPWLYLGYAHGDTALAGWAPISGVFGLSFFACATGVLLVTSLENLLQRKSFLNSALPLAGIIIFWSAADALKKIPWTQVDNTAISVGMVQANIPQELKWQPFYLHTTLELYRELSEPLWEQDWLIWPEAAIPMLYSDASAFLAEMDEQAKENNTALITGILTDIEQSDSESYRVNNTSYFNSIIGLGRASGTYHKQRLVPFGEYVPLEQWLRGLIHFFNLPTSIISPGPKNQVGLTVGELNISPFICYEIVYPSLVAKYSTNADVLITISNDAWFGESIGPPQHFQMAQMRALETGRYIIRATNNGISGIIKPDGSVAIQGGRFTRESITGEVYKARGTTPFMVIGNIPIIVVSLLGLGLIFIQLRTQ